MKNAVTDWNIDKSKLLDYENSEWNFDKFYETTDKKYGIFFYNIEEFRMLAYGSKFAIFNNSKSNVPLLNLKKLWIWFDEQKPFFYAEKSNCIIFRKPKSNTSYPFLLIKPELQIFASIEWDYTSIYYGLEEIDENNLILTEVYPEVLKISKSKPKNKFFNLDSLKWKNLNSIETL